MDLLLTLVIFLIIIGLIYWVVTQLSGAFGIPAPIVTVMYVIIVIVAIVFLLRLLQGGNLNLGL